MSVQHFWPRERTKYKKKCMQDEEKQQKTTGKKKNCCIFILCKIHVLDHGSFGADRTLSEQHRFEQHGNTCVWK